MRRLKPSRSMTTGAGGFGGLASLPSAFPGCSAPFGSPTARSPLPFEESSSFSLSSFRRRLALLLVALFRERRGCAPLQRRHVDRVRDARVGVLQGEPVALRAGVGGREEIEELPGLVEGGVRHVREAVGERVGLVLVEGVDVRRPDVRGPGERVGDPARVRRPRAAQHPVAHGCVESLGRDLLRGSARDVDDEERQGVVRQDDLLSVGRKDELVVEARAGNLDLLRRSFAVLRADDDFVLAALVRDVRDRLAVRRPRGRALVEGRRAREVAGVALLGGHGHDLAPELERGARAGRGERRTADPLRALRPARAGLEEIAGNRDRKVGDLLRGGVEEVKSAGLLEDDPISRRRGVQDGEVLEVGHTRRRLRLRVVRVEVELAVAVGAEEERRAEPDRVSVVAARRRLRDAVDRVRGHVEEPYPRDRAAAVALPLQVTGAVRTVGDRLSVGGVRGAVGVRDRQGRFEAAFDGHRVELRVAVVDRGARRREEDGFAVRREALHDVAARVPREALRHAAGGGDDEDVEVAVQLGAEREERAVRAEGGTHLHAGPRADALDTAAVEAAGPDVVPVDESDPVGRERGVREHLRRPARGRRGERNGGVGERQHEGKGNGGERHAHGSSSEEIQGQGTDSGTPPSPAPAEDKMGPARPSNGSSIDTNSRKKGDSTWPARCMEMLSDVKRRRGENRVRSHARGLRPSVRRPRERR